MIFNTVIDHLRQWCISKAEFYQKRYTEHGGIAVAAGYLVAYELEFKLLTLIDKPFENAEALRKVILNFIDVHYAPLLEPDNRSVEYIICKTNREFCDYFEEILSARDFLTPVDLPYKRVIVGSEADELKDKYRSVWGYVNTTYWYPLTDDEPNEIKDKFYIMFDRFKPYKRHMEQIIGLPQEHIYCYGENVSPPEYCIETTELIEHAMRGGETIYTDKGFSWAIYFSHESTVSFAGSIVPKAQELLLKEKAYWNKFEWM